MPQHILEQLCHTQNISSNRYFDIIKARNLNKIRKFKRKLEINRDCKHNFGWKMYLTHEYLNILKHLYRNTLSLNTTGSKRNHSDHCTAHSSI